MKKCLIVLSAALMLLTGCGINSQFENFENSAKLRVGMTKAQVREIMGEPLDVNFAKPDIWYYYIQTRWNDGQTTIDECMPLMFKNDKLVGWGNEFYNKETMLKKEYSRPQIDGLK